MLQEHLVSVLENKTIFFQMTTVPAFRNTFRPLVKTQMHVFNVEGTILGLQEVVHIIYSFIKNGLQQAGIHQVAIHGHYGYMY